MRNFFTNLRKKLRGPDARMAFSLLWRFAVMVVTGVVADKLFNRARLYNARVVGLEFSRSELIALEKQQRFRIWLGALPINQRAYLTRQRALSMVLYVIISTYQLVSASRR